MKKKAKEKVFLLYFNVRFMLLCNLLISFLGTNEEAIIYICTTRNNAQRQELKSKYKTSYGEVGSDH